MDYSFDFVDASGAIHHVDVGTFANDADATQAARQALRRSSTAALIRVWRENQMVTEVSEATVAGDAQNERPGR